MSQAHKQVPADDHTKTGERSIIVEYLQISDSNE